MTFELNWPSGFKREDVCKCCLKDAGVTGIQLARQRAFGSGELYIEQQHVKRQVTSLLCEGDVIIICRISGNEAFLKCSI